MKKNIHGFSLLLGIGIVLLLTTISLLLLEFIIPFSRNVKGLDNYTKSYYLGWQSIEQTLYSLALSNTPGTEITKVVPSTATGYWYTTTSSGNIFPLPGKGESEYDSNWGIIKQSTPIQIYLPVGINWASTFIKIRVPNFDKNTTTTESILASYNTRDIVNWQIISTGNTLNSISANRFKGSSLCSSNASCPGMSILGNGIDLNGNLSPLTSFYALNCTANNNCIFKLSLIEKLFLSSGNNVPYLEYQIVFSPSTVRVPYPTIEISASGKSYGFKKDFSFDFPLKFLNEAFDFTVFQ